MARPSNVSASLRSLHAVPQVFLRPHPALLPLLFVLADAARAQISHAIDSIPVLHITLLFTETVIKSVIWPMLLLYYLLTNYFV